MFLSCALLILAQWLTPAAATVHTGFACGAFWSQSQAKTKEDFVRQFNLAKNLPDVPVSFNSARLFQTAQWQTQNDPSEAFEAAIETNTTLLLGIWVSASDNELIALDHAFEKHGQKLADLVVGISVGNEDIYRTSDMCTQKNGGKPCDMAYSADEIKANISSVRSTIAQKPWIKLFKEPPPIGHTDIAQYAPLEGSDFIGMTAYPVWNKDSIENANESFFNSLAGVQERSGNTPVWITETGWPSSGSGADISPPSLESMQEYWTKVGCSLFGKYNVWWFELERDTDDGLDWGIIDIPSQTPKIKDLSC
ncbi:glycoside hydrolase family 17 protein, partial [Trematosphaeria pertusa]